MNAVFSICAALLGASMWLIGASCKAQSVEQLYKGQTLKIVTGFGAGSGYTAWARMLGPHWARPGDFVTWDNLCSSHARTDFSTAERRLFLRGVIKGEHRPAA